MSVSFNYQYPSGTNPFVPSYNWSASGQLVIDYSRNPKKFLVNQLVTITGVNQVAGYYPRFDPSVLNRVSDINTVKWADGQAFPAGPHNKQRFTNLSFACERVAEPYPVGYQERDQATWDVDKQAQRVLGNRMMSWRALTFYSLITTAGNYLSNNTDTATALAGGLLSAATVNSPYIKKLINEIERRLLLATNGVINRDALVMLLSPTVAYALSQTQELHAYLGNSPFALAQIQGDKPGQNKAYQLPDSLYGCKVVVDPTIQNSAVRDAAASNAFMAPANSIIFLVRPGDLPDNVGDFASNFSSVHMFSYSKEEMVVTSHDEPWNRRLMHQAYDTWDFKVVAPETLFLVTAVLS